MKRAQRLAPVIGVCLLPGLADWAWSSHNQKPTGGFQAHVPKMWDDAALSSLEVPLANPIGSPKADDEQVLDTAYDLDWRTCEYWSPHVAYYIWANSVLERLV